MKYIVMIKSKSSFDFTIPIYIQKVISYKRNLYIYTLSKDSAHKYCLEENAIKASNAFNGEVIIV